jgi:hypothetical protein
LSSGNNNNAIIDDVNSPIFFNLSNPIAGMAFFHAIAPSFSGDGVGEEDRNTLFTMSLVVRLMLSFNWNAFLLKTDDDDDDDSEGALLIVLLLVVASFWVDLYTPKEPSSKWNCCGNAEGDLSSNKSLRGIETGLVQVKDIWVFIYMLLHVHYWYWSA